MANFQFKIITKVLVDRLAMIAPNIISDNQRGFIRERHIKDYVCITSEAMNLLDKKAFGGNLAIKIDIKKAFETMDWNFLIKALRAFGFSDKFYNWVLVILQSARLSFSVNGHSVGFFRCKRGVRQGDPPSPLLFCIAEDVLSLAISSLVQTGELLPMDGPRGFSTPYHVLYADDIMIFCRGTKRNLQAIVNLFKLYGEASGQLISPNKCKFYPGAIASWRLQSISSILGFSVGRLLFTYLGVPIFKGKCTRSYLQPIADRLKTKLATWKGSMLSIMGRVQLVKSVIQGILVYSFHIYAWPISLLKTIDSWIRNFIWSGNISTRKMVTVAWHKLCAPTHEGGLGVRPLSKINEAATLKLCWDFMSNDSQWANVLRARFLFGRCPVPHYIKSSIWPGLKKCANVVTEHLAWQIDDGTSVNFWHDLWLPDRVLHLLHIPTDLHQEFQSKVCSFIRNSTWLIPDAFANRFPQVAEAINRIALPISPCPDRMVWSTSKSGDLSFKDAY